MDLSDLLPFLVSSVAALDDQMAAALTLRGLTLQQTQGHVATTVATVADVLQRMIDGDVTGTPEQGQQLRDLFDDLGAKVAEFDAAVAAGSLRT